MAYRHEVIFGFVFSFFLFLNYMKNTATQNFEISNNSFPKDFRFGVASSAYQIEGAHDLNGKGVNIWDHYLEKSPDVIKDSSNGNIACDSYHNYKEDVKMLKELGVDFYRFSISWARVLPTGYANEINEDGINYYNNLINELIANGIEPMVTMYHWDLPKSLQEIGGWTNAAIIDYFKDYARVLLTHFGDRVKYWITFNSVCHGYDNDVFPPFVNQPGVGNYLCRHILLLSHAQVYHMYDKEFRKEQNGRIGITVDDNWYAPASESAADVEAAERARSFILGTYMNPIFHKDGDYPEIVKKRVEELSRRQGYPRSRLPTFSKEEVEFVKNTYDFMGINIYTSFLVKDMPNDKEGTPSIRNDGRFSLHQLLSWPKSASEWLRVTPFCIRNALNWVKRQYGDVEIIITENGFSDTGELDDIKRIEYYQQYMSSLLDAIVEDNVNVKGYTAWSLMDNFEWLSGYTEKFGLYKVDFADPNRKRTAKKSAKWYKRTVHERRIASIDETDEYHEEL